MSTINATLPTLQDLASRMDPKGGIAKIMEHLTQKNAILKDAVWVEGNLPTGHLFTQRKSLPTGTWRRFNEGVAPSKSKTDQITESCGMLAAMSKVDCDLAKLNGNEAAFRASEDNAFIDGLSNDLETAMIYASTLTDPEKFMGFFPRLASTTGPWGGQIVDSQIAASGSDQASMLFAVWGPNTCHGIFPKGMVAGLQMEDGGKQLTRDASNNEFWAWVTSFAWKVGLAIPDPRYVVRLANIDTSAIAETGKLLIQDMVKAFHQVHDWDSGRGAIYCNRTIYTYLHLQSLDAVGNATLSIDKDLQTGKPVTHFLGVPIRCTDALTNTEAIVS